MREKILCMLKASDDYVSGQEICQRLNVSRTAVWKAINKLKEDGYNIEAVTNKGYRLITSPDVMYEQELRTVLDTRWFGNKILYFDSIDSTNNEIKRQAEVEKDHGLLAVAEEQTAGRGRRGRAWISPPGTGIWMSFMLTPQIQPANAPMLTLVAAMSVAEAIREVTGLDARIKWPNDIVVNAHKVCGMLTEMSAEMECVNYVVIGIGINANTESFPEEISQVATSLAIEKGDKVSRAQIIAATGRAFEKYYDSFMKTGDLSLLRKEYDSLLVNAGQQVKIIGQDSEQVLTAIGINDQGELLVANDDKEVTTVRSGEVSVRGLYGYV